MSDETSKPEPKPVKPKDLDYQKIADDLTQTPEVITSRTPPVEATASQQVAKPDTGESEPEPEEMADEDQADGEAAPPGGAEAGKGGPRSKLGKALTVSVLGSERPIFTGVDVPDHTGELRAAAERHEAKIRYRLAAYLDQLLERIEQLPLIEQARLAPMLQQMHMNAFDQAITTHWTKKLEKAILEKITLLQNAKGTPRLRGLGAVAAQVAKEIKTDGRTVAARNKKGAGTVGRFSDLPGAEQG